MHDARFIEGGTSIHYLEQKAGPEGRGEGLTMAFCPALPPGRAGQRPPATGPMAG